MTNEDKLAQALRRAERKLSAYVGVCAGDTELTNTILPMCREVLAAHERAQPASVEDGWRPSDAEVKAWGERNDVADELSLRGMRTAIDDARSMHMLSAAQPASVPDTDFDFTSEEVNECFDHLLEEGPRLIPTEVMQQMRAFCLAAHERAQPASVADDCVLVALHRPAEGYEDVHPELVAEDAIREGWCYDVLTAPQPAKEGE